MLYHKYNLKENQTNSVSETIKPMDKLFQCNNCGDKHGPRQCPA